MRLPAPFAPDFDDEAEAATPNATPTLPSLTTSLARAAEELEDAANFIRTVRPHTAKLMDAAVRLHRLVLAEHEARAPLLNNQSS